jgi:DNA excision repair protein ERCC-2
LQAHNIDNICIEALSVTVNQPTVTAASANLNRLTRAISQLENTNSKRLEDEYKTLLQGLAASGTLQRNNEATEAILASPVLPSDMMAEAVPGNIRKAKHFIMFLKTIVEVRLRSSLLSFFPM